MPLPLAVATVLLLGAEPSQLRVSHHVPGGSRLRMSNVDPPVRLREDCGRTVERTFTAVISVIFPVCTGVTVKMDNGLHPRLRWYTLPFWIDRRVVEGCSSAAVRAVACLTRGGISQHSTLRTRLASRSLSAPGRPGALPQYRIAQGGS
ncbi:hypothetical protein PYCCODRAFT_903457 [Trametes coccinea BRFM310]|uniref:Uncharacterized protein n=1 Tax=Trametes coccinea (strain BRFM310) TaxID=1353009 RepID=A0A1Y2ICM1_TRAC3|nr:hypothetical protein PYCCODRAFT_903457 [Trametes coccinea BRFM310]